MPIAALLWVTLGCEGPSADAAAGRVSAVDSGTAAGGDSGARETTFDDCAEVVGASADQARWLVSLGSDSVVAVDAVEVFTESATLGSWMQASGVSAEGVADQIDFGTEQAVGYISRWGNASFQGKQLASFAWSADATTLVGVVAVDEPCEGADDDLPLVQVWATPRSPVSVCERGIRCLE